MKVVFLSPVLQRGCWILVTASRLRWYNQQHQLMLKAILYRFFSRSFYCKIQGDCESPILTITCRPEFDECVSFHSCALSSAIPLHGVLYVYNSRMCFFSAYNAATLIGRATIVTIPISEVDRVDKRKTGAIFDEAMEVMLKCKLSFLFTALKERDQAFSHANQLIQWQRRLQPNTDDLSIECIRQTLTMEKEDALLKSKMPAVLQEDVIMLSDDDSDDWEEVNQPNSFEISAKNDSVSAEKLWRGELKQKLIEVYQPRVTRIRDVVLASRPPLTWSSVSLPGITAKEVFLLFFGNNAFEDDKKKRYVNFSAFYNLTVAKELDMTFTEIHPAPPVYFSNLYENNKLEVVDYADFSQRTCSFRHPISEPFMPKTCDCVMKERIHWVSPAEFIIDRELTLQGIPLASSFSPQVLYIIRESDEGTEIQSSHYIKYLKDTWFKGKIEKTSNEENVKNWKHLKDLYLKYAKIWVDNREKGEVSMQQTYCESRKGKEAKGAAGEEHPVAQQKQEEKKAEEENIIQLEDEIEDEERQLNSILQAAQQPICRIF